MVIHAERGARGKSTDRVNKNSQCVLGGMIESSEMIVNSRGQNAKREDVECTIEGVRGSHKTNTARGVVRGVWCSCTDLHQLCSYFTSTIKY